MAEEKKKKAPKAPKWTSAFIWAASLWAIAWFITDENLPEVVSVTFGGFVAGWCSAGLLGKFARWGAGIYAMMVLGVIVGVLFFSGAASALKLFHIWWTEGAVFEDSWEKLKEFIISDTALPTLALGLFTGAFVRAQIPAKKK